MLRSDLADTSTADLVKLASEQVKGLVRDEVQLAKTEMTEKGKLVGVGAGLFGGAAVLAFYGVGVLLAAIVLALALVLPAWASALIVAVLLFAGAAGCALLGRSRVKRVASAKPEDTLKSVRADVTAVSSAFKEGRHA